jgi:hypothetical protein
MYKSENQNSEHTENTRLNFGLVNLELMERKIKRIEKEQKIAEAERDKEITSLSKIMPLLPVVKSFSRLLRATYPNECSTPAMSQALMDFNTIPYLEMEHLETDISVLLMRICYSDGEHKVYDWEDVTYYNDLACSKVLDAYVLFQERWVKALIQFLKTNDPIKFLILGASSLKNTHPRLLPLFFEATMLFKPDVKLKLFS